MTHPFLCLASCLSHFHQILTRTNHLSYAVHIHLYLCSCFVGNCLTFPSLRKFVSKSSETKFVLERNSLLSYERGTCGGTIKISVSLSVGGFDEEWSIVSWRSARCCYEATQCSSEYTHTHMPHMHVHALFRYDSNLWNASVCVRVLDFRECVLATLWELWSDGLQTESAGSSAGQQPVSRQYERWEQRAHTENEHTRRHT